MGDNYLSIKNELMPLITLPIVNIEIDIPDLIVNEITIKRKAKLFSMNYNQNAPSLTLTWIVHYPDLEGVKGYLPYSKQSIADNTTMVDAQTGAIVLPTEVQDTNEDGTLKVDDNGNPVMVEKIVYDGNYVGQYDWFNYIAETQPVKVHDMIRQYGMQADWS